MAVLPGGGNTAPGTEPESALEMNEVPGQPNGLAILFGDIALAEGVVTQAQIEEALRSEQDASDPRPLGEILLGKGYLDQDQLRCILEIQRSRLQQADPMTWQPLRDSLFGKKAIALGLATEKEVNDALRAQARSREGPERVRLGDVLVNNQVLTRGQVRKILKQQGKEVLFCPACLVQYNVGGFEPGRSFRCHSCGGRLKVFDPKLDAEAPRSEGESRRAGPATGLGDGFGSETGPDGASPTEYPAGGEIQGKEFGNYRLLRKIAQGAVGIVYEALQKDLNRVVALKVLLAGDGASEETVQRFYIEASAAAKLDHPSIVPIHEFGVMEGRHFFTMDYIKGRTLSRIIDEGGLPIREALILTKKVAEGLDYAHGKGIIHRDVKPANIIIDHLGNPRITDFGIAKVLESDDRVTMTGQMMGTPTYMSPEQAMGHGDIDGRVDVYSLGAVLYELLTSRPPFESENSMDLLIKALKEEPPAPRSLNPTIHKDVETICLKALEKDPRRRYLSAKEMSKDIERYINGETIQARPIAWWERIWRGIARHKTLSASAAVALLAVLGISAFAVAARARAERARVQKVQSHIEMGQARMGDGDLARAKLEFEKALAIDSNSRDAAYGIEDVERGLLRARDALIQEGDVLFDQGEYKEADEKYREAIEIDRKSEEAKRGIHETAKALVEAGKTDALRQEAEGLLQKGLHLAEKARHAPLESAGALYPEAIILIRQAAARDPVKDPVASKTLGALFDLLLEYAAVALRKESFEMSSFLLSEAELLGNDPERVDKLREEVDE
ncbi:MAG: protein kinase, partial [Planctomycetota bacterium]|nr:protein kinase [Planctomycetota bacterium]